MDPALLYCSVFYESDDNWDKEAWDIWTKEVGIPESHMARLGKEDNFWEHGKGPCGPCSEIYYDRGEQYGCGAPGCAVGCDCDRYVEFYDLVFTQFDSDGAGNYAELETKNIDTGLGLERLGCICQGVDQLFEIDTVRSIREHISRISGVAYHADPESDLSLRVITDHARATVMLIGDGVLPSNEGRGYVLRRLLRRAARHGRLLGIGRLFLCEVAETVIEENAGAYPSLHERREFILRVIANEEENFSRTIDAGLQLLEKMIADTAGPALSGEDAFKLSDTFGFPIDLTKEILAENGMAVEEEKYKALMKEQRERSRAARKEAGGWDSAGDVDTAGLPATQFVGYETDECEATVLAVEGDIVILDKTPFYAESGGQCGDTGWIGKEYNAKAVNITDTKKTLDGVILHYCTADVPHAGDIVKANVDSGARWQIRRNHTAAHLLHAALREVLGTHVEQAGQSVTPHSVRFDFTHFAALTWEELRKVTLLVNKSIWKAIPVETETLPIEEAKARGAMALFGEKYGDTVRMVRIPGCSMELCGGTHAANTGNLGMFIVTSESSVASGVRRIEALTGDMAQMKYRADQAKLRHIAEALKTNDITELAARAESVMAQLKETEKALAAAREKLSAYAVRELLQGAREIGGVRFVSGTLECDAAGLRQACDIARQSGEDTAALFACATEKGTLQFAAACAPGAVQLGAHAGNIAKAAAQAAGGSGGGKPDSAMAGGKDPAKRGEALAAGEAALRSMLNR